MMAAEGKPLTNGIRLYLTYGLQMIGGDAINAYAVWVHVPGRGQRPLVGLKMSRQEAEEALDHWHDLLLRRPEILDNREWFDCWCGKEQIVV